MCVYILHRYQKIIICKISEKLFYTDYEKEWFDATLNGINDTTVDSIAKQNIENDFY